MANQNASRAEKTRVVKEWRMVSAQFYSQEKPEDRFNDDTLQGLHEPAAALPPVGLTPIPEPDPEPLEVRRHVFRLGTGRKDEHDPSLPVHHERLSRVIHAVVPGH